FDTAASNTGTVDLTANTLAAGNLLVATGGTTYTVAIAASAALSTIESDINGTAGLSSAVTASDDGAGQAAFGLASAAQSPTSTTRTTLQGNYNALLTQIDQLAGDSSYNGVNLLNGDNLKVLFNE